MPLVALLSGAAVILCGGMILYLESMIATPSS
jgi:hypothetical protein